MIHKIIGYGSNGSKGVMDYMLKEEDKKTPRFGATVLRGDIDMQSKIIDSLVGEFKQTYVVGCFSFEESPDEVTEQQKQELMNGAEELLLAGLSPDRVAISWIEHTDKVHDDINNPRYGQNRLELNYIVACVDLEHGRAFQPYVHHIDQDRFNAFKDIQNIKHNYTDPNDPIKAQNLAQTRNLPKDVAELKESITKHIESLVIQGLVNNRDDVKQALNDLGFELSRETKSSISVKRPDGGRNLKFTTAKHGGLYDINFRPDKTSAAEIRAASESFRASATERLRTAQSVYDTELERKREYHQKRHSRPKRNQPRVTRAVNPAFAIFKQFDRRYALTVPNPYTATLKKRAKRDKRDDRELHKQYSAIDREQGEQNNAVNKIRLREMDDSSRDSVISDIHLGQFFGGRDSKQSNRTADFDLQSQSEWNSRLLSARRVNEHEQAITRQNTSSPRQSTANDRTSETYARQQRQEYSSLAEIARTANNNANRATTTLADSIRELEEYNQRTEKLSEQLVSSSKRTNADNEHINERVNETIRASNSADRAYETVSEYDSTAREVGERYTAVRERTGRLSKLTAENYEQAEVIGRTATATAKVTATIEIAREKEQQKQQQVTANRSYNRPRMR